MSKFYRWLLKKYLTITKLKKDETIVIAFKEELSQRMLESISEELIELLGEKVVLIGGVDKIIVA